MDLVDSSESIEKCAKLDVPNAMNLTLEILSDGGIDDDEGDDGEFEESYLPTPTDTATLLFQFKRSLETLLSRDKFETIASGSNIVAILEMTANELNIYENLEELEINFAIFKSELDPELFPYAEEIDQCCLLLDRIHNKKSAQYKLEKNREVELQISSAKLRDNLQKVKIDEKVACMNCEKQEGALRLGLCGHHVCQECLQELTKEPAGKTLEDIRCPVCSSMIAIEDLYVFHTKEEVAELLEVFSMTAIEKEKERGGLVECPKCNFLFERKKLTMQEMKDMLRKEQDFVNERRVLLLAEKEIQEARWKELKEGEKKQDEDHETIPEEDNPANATPIPNAWKPIFTSVPTIDGRSWSDVAKLHRYNNRFKCLTCGTEFCCGCHKEPYHEGMTCEVFKEYEASMECRFCGLRYEPGPRMIDCPPAIARVCQDPPCQESASQICLKVHPCGHFCQGFRDENECLRCLHEDCCADDQNLNAWCTICGVDTFAASPCIEMKCGHVFHRKCVLERLQKKWPGRNITFQHMHCPLCSEAFQTKNNCMAIAREMSEGYRLFDEIMRKSYALMKKDDRSSYNIKVKRDRLSLMRAYPKAYPRLFVLIPKKRKKMKMKKLSENDAMKFKELQRILGSDVMEDLNFYLCHNCRSPYYGGRRQCGQGDAEDDDDIVYICDSCSGVKNNRCKAHGEEAIAWKCRFCCNVASWFCFGNTHFCGKCHDQYPNNPIIPCPGPSECPFAPHPEGVEHCLGFCMLCRYAKMK